MKNKQTNITMIEIVAKGLGDQLKHVVFVGGATTALYLDEETAPHLRATDDVDCIVEITSKNQYYQLEEKLRQLGFKNISEPNIPICRFIFGGIKVDIMPTESEILGFSNIWYKAGMANSETYQLPSGTNIRVLAIPYFLSTKSEAFSARGNNDFSGSKDIEDIVTVLDGSHDCFDKLMLSPMDIRSYLANTFKSWLSNKQFLNSFIGHLPPDPSNASRAKRLLAALNDFVSVISV